MAIKSAPSTVRKKSLRTAIVATFAVSLLVILALVVTKLVRVVGDDGGSDSVTTNIFDFQSQIYFSSHNNSSSESTTTQSEHNDKIERDQKPSPSTTSTHHLRSNLSLKTEILYQAEKKAPVEQENITDIILPPGKRACAIKHSNTSLTRQHIIFPDDMIKEFVDDNCHFYGFNHRQIYKFFYPLQPTTAELMESKHELDIYKASPYYKPSVPMYNAGSKSLSTLRYLHIPKTGTTFAITTLHYCCPLLENVTVDILIPNSRYHIWKYDAACRICLFQPVTINGDYFSHVPYLPITPPDHHRYVPPPPSTIHLDLLTPNATLKPNLPTSTSRSHPTTTEKTSTNKPYLVTMLRNPKARLNSQLHFLLDMFPLVDTFGLSHREELDIFVHIVKRRFHEIPAYLYSIRHLLHLPYDDGYAYRTPQPQPSPASPLPPSSSSSSSSVGTHKSSSALPLTPVTASSSQSVAILLNRHLYPKRFHPFLTLLQQSIEKTASSPTAARKSNDEEHSYKVDKYRWLLLASYPGMKGCQVKMILGYSCLEHRVELTAAHIALAKARLAQEFAFFGLTEHWNASIHLFHAQYGGQVYPEEFQVFRPSDYKKGTSMYRGERISAKKILDRAHFRDEYDEELYAFAQQLFLERLQQQTHVMKQQVQHQVQHQVQPSSSSSSHAHAHAHPLTSTTTSSSSPDYASVLTSLMSSISILSASSSFSSAATSS